jgi:hypothetical protein
MKKRALWSLMLMAITLAVTVPVAFAYDAARGQVNDANGSPWTHGGAVTCVHSTNNVQVGSAAINPDGSWYVNLALTGRTTCTVDPAPGPAGDPAPYTCSIPNGAGQSTYDCGTKNLSAGPNAVGLASFSARSEPLTWLVAPIALVGAWFLWKRRR